MTLSTVAVLRSHSGSCVSASSSLNACADTITSDGTHPGNAVRVTRCAPEALCSSCRASRAPTPNRSARRTSGGQSRRWTRVTLPLTRGVATIAEEERARLIASKIS
jgi:MinD superfamily P-loop ATPase